MFNLWKPLMPAGVEGTWAPVKEAGRMAWYFNQNYPWLGMLFCAPIIGLWYWCTDQYIVQRDARRARTRREARRGTIFAAFLKLLPVFIFIVPGMIAVALARSGRTPGLGMLVDADGNVVPAAAQAAFPLLVQHVMPAGAARDGGGGAARRAHELAGRRLQRVVHAVHDRLLSQVQAERVAGAARLDRTRRDDRDGR